MSNDEITEINTLDTARILDQEENEWTAGYLMVYRRLKQITLINNITFDNNTTTYTSKEFKSEPYSKFSLLIDLSVSGTPTDIVIEVEVSPGGGKWYKLMNGPFGDLRYEDAGGAKKESIQGEIRAHKIRIKATATDTTAVNKFTLSADIIMASM